MPLSVEVPCRNASSHFIPIQQRYSSVSEFIFRFVFGGLVVSAFAVLGDALKPKSFAGIFGAAPSVALATLSVTFANKGSAYAAAQGQTMIAGAIALLCYSLLVTWLILRHRYRAIVATSLSWLVWLVVAFGIFGIWQLDHFLNMGSVGL